LQVFFPFCLLLADLRCH